jgi:hypothetical protein
VGNVPSGSFVALTSTAADISSVSIGFAAGSTADFIDDVTFSRGAATSVPEPATRSLLVAGLFGLFGLCWQRRRLSAS